MTKLHIAKKQKLTNVGIANTARCLRLCERSCEQHSKMRAGKKALMSFNMIAMIPRILFLVVVLMSCVILIRFFIINEFDTRELQTDLLVNGLLYSPGGAGWYDAETGRTFPEVIDLQQFSDRDFDHALFFPGNNFITARIEVFSQDFIVLGTGYYNRQWYQNWEPLVTLNIPGLGGIVKIERQYPIILRQPTGEFSNGFVRFTVLQPK